MQTPLHKVLHELESYVTLVDTKIKVPLYWQHSFPPFPIQWLPLTLGSWPQYWFLKSSCEEFNGCWLVKEIQNSKLSLQQCLTKLSLALFKISILFQKRRLYWKDLVFLLPAVHNEVTDTWILNSKDWRNVMRKGFSPSKKLLLTPMQT